jgi:hypothetical protein
MITWISTKSPRGMLDTPVDRKTADYLNENRGIDAALLAVELGRRGISRIHIEAWRRRYYRKASDLIP